MKKITLIALTILALMVTAAVAHQGSWTGNHMRGSGSINGSCPMNGNSNGARMMDQNGTVKGLENTSQVNGQENNWKVNPSYQGQSAISEK